MPKILLILNTFYHVESTIGIYFTLKSMGYPCEIYLTNPNTMKFQFFQFMEKLSIKCISEGEPYFDIGIIMTLHSQWSNPMPNGYHSIISNNKKKLIYNSHTVPSNPKSMLLKDKNIFFLTPIAERYNYDFLYLFDFPIHLFQIEQKINKIAVISHFERYNRDTQSILDIDINNLPNYEIDIIGTKIPNQLKNINKINIYEDTTEIQLYSILSNSKYMFMAISPLTRDGTYITERISSVAVQAQYLNKPIIWHKSIAEIYNFPGITFENTNEINNLIKINQSTEFNFKTSIELRKKHNFNVIGKILKI